MDGPFFDGWGVERSTSPTGSSEALDARTEWSLLTLGAMKAEIGATEQKTIIKVFIIFGFVAICKGMCYLFDV
jgi:hypothetical protein